jgi:hypothetical protein
VRVYVDDVLAGENDNISTSGLYAADTTLPGSFPSSLGIYSQAHWEKSCFFKGQISNVMVYNKALNSQEIENLTNQIADSLSIPKPSSATVVQPSPRDYALGILAAVATAIILSIVLLFYRRNKLKTKPPKANN